MEIKEDVFNLATEEIVAFDAEVLEQRVSIRESEGWTRQGEPTTLTLPEENGVSETKWVQVVMKNPEGEIPPQD
jgi:hypothetical protein